MTYLITGGCGFVGSNLAATLLASGEKVIVFDNLSREGSASNLQWLRTLGLGTFVHGDIRNPHDMERLIAEHKPAVIFHLSGQVAMTTSMADPRKDFEINVAGSINVLESVRRQCPSAAIVYSSSNKVYGALEGVKLVEEKTRYSAPALPLGVDEKAPLDFQTPYGCSKGAADQYMLDYARSHGLRTVVFRHSTIYGGRQFATFDQGWVGWFCRQALESRADSHREPFTVSGDGKQVRDLLFVDDVVHCYLMAARHIERAQGHAFNIGGGMANSCSVVELLALLEGMLGVSLRYRHLPWRHLDQKFFVADNSKATRLLEWTPAVSRHDGLRKMLEWESNAAMRV